MAITVTWMQFGGYSNCDGSFVTADRQNTRKQWSSGTGDEDQAGEVEQEHREERAVHALAEEEPREEGREDLKKQR